MFYSSAELAAVDAEGSVWSGAVVSVVSGGCVVEGVTGGPFSSAFSAAWICASSDAASNSKYEKLISRHLHLHIRGNTNLFNGTAVEQIQACH